MSNRYTVEHVKPLSELSKFIWYCTAYCEIDGNKVLREVQLLLDGRLLRFSADRYHNEAPGSLRADAPSPELAEREWYRDNLQIEWIAKQEFEKLWAQASWRSSEDRWGQWPIIDGESEVGFDGSTY